MKRKRFDLAAPQTWKAPAIAAPADEEFLDGFRQGASFSKPGEDSEKLVWFPSHLLLGRPSDLRQTARWNMEADTELEEGDFRKAVANLQPAVEACLTRFLESRLELIPYSATLRWDLPRAAEDLARGRLQRDVFFDRAGVPVVYVARHGVSRVNDAASTLAASFWERRMEDTLEVIDFGSGSGSVLLALIALRQALSNLGQHVPSLKIRQIDVSPFMLHAAREVFEHAQEHLPEGATGVSTLETVGPWQRVGGTEAEGELWVTMAWVMEGEERGQDLESPFRTMLKRLRPDRVFLLGGEDFPGRFKTITSKPLKGYDQAEVEGPALFSGDSQQLAGCCRDLGTHCPSLAGVVPTWGRESSARYVLQASEPAEQRRIARLRPVSPVASASSLSVQRSAQLDPRQEEAAKHVDRPVMVVGPAGSGKSLVLVKSVLNGVTRFETEVAPPPGPVRFLVTATNEPLVDQLAGWLGEGFGQPSEPLFDASGGRIGHTFSRPGVGVDLVKFDALPTRFGRDPGPWEPDEATHVAMLEELLPGLLEACGGKVREPYRDAQYVLSEYHRVVYGQSLETEEAYQDVERKGRGRQTLPSGGPARRFLWQAMKAYLAELQRRGMDSVITRRWKFLEELKSSPVEGYDRIFVDEYQDFTPADIDILYALTKHPNGLTLAGDGAQAVFVGGSTTAPRERSRSGQSPFKWHRLEASYRLPYWASKCIFPLSKALAEKNDYAWALEANQAAPPGVRPIIVGGEDEEELAREVSLIFRAYAAFDLDALRIFERDERFAALYLDEGGDGRAETMSVLEQKGLEFPFVLWSTSTPLPSRYDVLEQAYSILTRTVAVLVITVGSATRPEFLEALRLLDTKYSMYWNAAAKRYLEDFRMRPLAGEASISVSTGSISDSVGQ